MAVSAAPFHLFACVCVDAHVLVPSAGPLSVHDRPVACPVTVEVGRHQNPVTAVGAYFPISSVTQHREQFQLVTIPVLVPI